MRFLTDLASGTSMNSSRIWRSSERIMHSSSPGSLGSSGSSVIRSTSAHHTDWAKASRESTEVWLIRHVTPNSLSAGLRALEPAGRAAAGKQVRTEAIQSGNTHLDHDQCQLRSEFAQHGTYAV